MPWRSTTLIEHLLSVATATLGQVCVVLGDRADDVLDEADLGLALVVIDPEWEEGSAGSLRAGLDTMTRESDAEAVVLIDATYPPADDSLLEVLTEAHRYGGSLVTVLKYRYTLAGPLVVDRQLWPRLMGMEGEADVIRLVHAHPEWVAEHWVDQLPPRQIADLEERRHGASGTPGQVPGILPAGPHEEAGPGGR
jgi:CTP:molybdopterin cytidylyltransferase MocA